EMGFYIRRVPEFSFNSLYKRLHAYGEDPDWMGLNARNFLVRNCEWSHRFLEKWIEMGAPENLQAAKKAINTVVKNRPQEWDPDDQSALVYLLNKNKTKSERNVFLETSYSLHGYFEYIIDKYAEGVLVVECDQFILTKFKNRTDDLPPRSVVEIQRRIPPHNLTANLANFAGSTPPTPKLFTSERLML
ncbi:hypothetical protein KI387_001911, partial [Taxus chinensis]